MRGEEVPEQGRFLLHLLLEDAQGVEVLDLEAELYVLEDVVDHAAHEYEVDGVLDEALVLRENGPVDEQYEVHDDVRGELVGPEGAADDEVEEDFDGLYSVKTVVKAAIPIGDV